MFFICITKRLSLNNTAAPFAKILAMLAIISFTTLHNLAYSANQEPLNSSIWKLSSSNNQGALSNAVNRELSSRWTTSKKQEGDEYLTIDLAKIENLSHLQMVTAYQNESTFDYPRNLKVHLSLDGQNWALLTQVNGAQSGTTMIDLNDRKARYIKLEQTGYDSFYWWSIHDLAVYPSVSNSNDNQGPISEFAAPTPKNNSSISAGETIDVEVKASDVDGDVANVTLFLNNEFVRQENVSPYEWNSKQDAKLDTLAPGEYQLRADATDNSGTVTSVITNFLLNGGMSTDDDTPTESNKLKVFILAGQSNMEGKGRIFTQQQNIDKNGGLGTLEYLVTAPETISEYGRLQSSPGEWLMRDDVTLVNYSETELKTSGPLTVTVTGSQTFGPELQFGQIMGDFYDQHVLIIKVAEGSRSLANDFRPPSSGGVTGNLYNVIVDRVNEVLGNLEQVVPSYDGQGYEILGFGWHQGFNDRFDLTSNSEYQLNMVNFINDIREDLNVNEMPFVIANTGMGGPNETNQPLPLALIAAQQAASEDSRLNHKDVYTIDTRPFWREDAVSPATESVHWNANAETYLLIGNSLAEEILKLN